MIRLLITAGTGPVEVRRFVGWLAEALSRELPVSSSAASGDPPASVILTVESDTVDGWVGTHALHHRSESRGKRARARWYAAVSVLPELPAGATLLDPADVEVKATRSGGPGGQSVNTTDSAVIARHRPSGIAVRVDGERSQHANRQTAMRRLAEALAEVEAQSLADAAREQRQRHYQLVRGAPVAQWRVDPLGELRRDR